MSDYTRHRVSRAYNLLRARGLRPSTIQFLCQSRADLARSRHSADLLGAIADRAAREGAVVPGRAGVVCRPLPRVSESHSTVNADRGILQRCREIPHSQDGETGTWEWHASSIRSLA